MMGGSAEPYHCPCFPAHADWRAGVISHVAGLMPDGILDWGRRVGIPEALDLSPGCARCCALTGQLRIDFQATSSVRESAGRWRRPALPGRTWHMTWEEAGPLVTVVVRCDPVVRGPDVAPMWPHGPELGRRVRSRRPGLLLARGGHGRRVPTALQRGGDGHKLNRRVRPVQDDHPPRWQAATGGAAGIAEYGPAGWPDEWTGFGWRIAVAAGRAAPAARRWQTGLGSALSGGPVPARRARSATGAAAGRLAHQPLSQPAGSRAPGGVPLEGRFHRDRRAPTLRGAVGPDRHPGPPSCLAC
jgi:hypothetical protein